MNGITFFVKCMKQYARFSGRARRREFWWFVLTVWIISVMVKLGVGALAPIDVVRAVSGVVSLAFLPPYVAVASRRLHDVGRSAWFMLVPFYNLYLFVKDGVSGPNIYGANPKTDAP